MSILNPFVVQIPVEKLALKRNTVCGEVNILLLLSRFSLGFCYGKKKYKSFALLSPLYYGAC